MLNTTGKAITLGLLTLLAACQSTDGLKVQDQGFHIISVGVTLPNQGTAVELHRYTDGLREMMTNTFDHYASEYNAMRPQAKTGYTLALNIEKVHFKVGLGSVVPGDANYVIGSASLVRPSDGQNIHTVPVKYIDGASAVVGGVSGAVLSLIVAKETVEQNLAKGAAQEVMNQVYPDIELSAESNQRLKNETVFQPVRKPISPLSGFTYLPGTNTVPQSTK